MVADPVMFVTVRMSCEPQTSQVPPQLVIMQMVTAYYGSCCIGVAADLAIPDKIAAGMVEIGHKLNRSLGEY